MRAPGPNLADIGLADLLDTRVDDPSARCAVWRGDHFPLPKDAVDLCCLPSGFPGDANRRPSLLASGMTHTAGPITREATGRVEKMMFALFVTLVCALAALLYFVSVRRGLPPERPEQEREKYRELRW